MAPVSRRTIFGLIATRLLTVTNAYGYYGRIGRALIEPAPVGWVPDPPVKDPEDDPRVQPYFVLYPGAGGDGPDAPLSGVDDGLDLAWQITAAGGDVEDVLALIDRLDAQLIGWYPTVTGLSFGRVMRLPGTRPQLLPDKTVSPERTFAPLQYVLTATN
jgi:hypothetical protein